LPNIGPVNDTDTAHVDVVHPDIQVVKSASATIVYNGDTVTHNGDEVTHHG